MFYRYFFALLAFFSINSGFIQTAFAGSLYETIQPKASAPAVFKLVNEPIVRVGLAMNASSAAITTADSQLVSVSPDEPQKFLATTRVVVSARSYRPPEIENYYFEIPNIETQTEAQTIAADLREATQDAANYSLDAKTNKWKIRVDEKFDSIEEANEYKALLSDKGFDEAEMITERVKQHSPDAVALSRQVNAGGKSQVRSLIKPTVSAIPADVVNPAGDVVNPIVNANLREVIVSGTNPAAKFSSLKSVAFGSVNERAMPVRFNGKPYRGKIEVFVNSRGSLTVVNAVPLEEYLRGVVPNELSLPALEAQKAQAVAARTYTVANIGQFGSQGFDLLPTVRSQVYRGYSSETAIATQAVNETRGLVATYKGKPIMAYYTSTCGGRTENSENIFDHGEPYLRGVECSLEGKKHFEPFLIKTARPAAKIEKEENLQLVRLMSLFAVNNFQLSTAQMTDKWFEEEPTQSEISNWTNNLAVKFGKTFPNVTKDTAKPVEFAKILASMLYAPAQNDTLMSESDINYQLSFDDAAEIPPASRADIAALMRDGFLAIYPDYSLKPNKPMSRARMLRVIEQIYNKKKWMPMLQTGTTKSSENGRLILRVGRTDKPVPLKADVFLFRQFGDSFYQVKETALVGGESVNYRTNAMGEIDYLEVKPTTGLTTAERMSPLTLWTASLSPSAVQSRLARYVRGLSGSLIDVRIAKQGYSRRATDLEIITTNGTYHLTGGKIRSALRFKEQLFVLNKRYDANGRAVSYNFTGRGWGHGVGMCQYGAYGLAKMGVKYDQIVKHYYTGVDLTKAY